MYPIPLHAECSHAVLPPEAVAALFGDGYTLKGTERVEVVALGRPVATVEARAGTPLRLVLDAFDREALPMDALLRLVGPRGVASPDAPAEALLPLLVLPPGLLTAWGLAPGRRVAVAVGRVVLTEVPVEEGTEVYLRTDRAVRLAGGTTPGDTARWLPDYVAPTASVVAASEGSPLPPRVITENDVRQARKRRETLQVAPGQIVTPAARALGRELGVLLDGAGSR